MIKLWRLRDAVENQFRNLHNLLSGRPVTLSSLGSMTLEGEDINLARNWLKKDRSHWYEERPVRDYQEEFARWNGSKHAYAFMGGRVALSACIHALGLRVGDEVIVPGYTCVVVPNAFHFAGINTVYCDIELETFGLDANSLESIITPNTRAILIHHLYGIVCKDYEKLLAIAKRHEIPVIEDCAQALGASYRGIKVGNRGALGIYSSEQSKVINTIQGGVAVTNNNDLGNKLQEFWLNAPQPNQDFIDKLLHNVLLNYYGQKHQQRWLLQDVINIRYGDKRLISTTLEEEHGKRPANYGAKMPAPVACLGLIQLHKTDRFNAKRRETAEKWNAWCQTEGYQTATVLKDSVPVFLRYPLLVEAARKAERDWARQGLGIDLGVWFKSNIHPANRTVLNCPHADEAVEKCVNFPTLLL